MKSQRPKLQILIGTRATSPLVKRGRRPPPSPMERLHTLFQRRPQLDLTKFFVSAATTTDNEMSDSRIIDHGKLKQAIQQVNYVACRVVLCQTTLICFIIESQC